jgi:hypothetical protein
MMESGYAITIRERDRVAAVLASCRGHSGWRAGFRAVVEAARIAGAGTGRPGTGGEGNGERRRYFLVSTHQNPRDWDYGNAVHDGNMVLGLVALRSGSVAQAREYLLEAGKTPGSPQLNSFGTNMQLAKELVEKDERDVVLQYFDLCRKFWKMDRGRLDQWSATVRGGGTPDFGANLLY